MSLNNQIEAFLLSIAIGLLIGLERERRSSAKAGLRTFALVALFGTLTAMLGERAGTPWMLAAGLAAVAGLIITAHAVQPDADDPGTTTVAALLVCYCLGAAVWLGFSLLAVMLAIATTVLLYFKTELKGIASRLAPQDYTSMLQFGVLSLIILPVLPDRDFGPYGAFNPHQTWLMVVLISGVSLAGYAALRLVGAQHGAPLIGVFGGLVSSTATTLVFARHARSNDALAPTAMVVILLANLVMLLRIGTLVAVFAPSLLRSFLVVLGSGLVPALAVALYGWLRVEAGSRLPMPVVRNPTEIRAAVGFGLLYALVLFLAAWLSDLAGDRGLYAVALVSGLTDVDAITLSSLRLFGMQALAAAPTVIAISLAALANLGFKFGLVVVIGGWSLARRVLPGVAAAALGLGAGLLMILA